MISVKPKKPTVLWIPIQRQASETNPALVPPTELTIKICQKSEQQNPASQFISKLPLIYLPHEEERHIINRHMAFY